MGGVKLRSRENGSGIERDVMSCIVCLCVVATPPMPPTPPINDRRSNSIQMMGPVRCSGYDRMYYGLNCNVGINPQARRSTELSSIGAGGLSLTGVGQRGNSRAACSAKARPFSACVGFRHGRTDSTASLSCHIERRVSLARQPRPRPPLAFFVPFPPPPSPSPSLPSHYVCPS